MPRQLGCLGIIRAIDSAFKAPGSAKPDDHLVPCDVAKSRRETSRRAPLFCASVERYLDACRLRIYDAIEWSIARQPRTSRSISSSSLIQNSSRASRATSNTYVRRGSQLPS